VALAEGDDGCCKEEVSQRSEHLSAARRPMQAFDALYQFELQPLALKIHHDDLVGF
jgi:hypothetical protein